MRHLAIIALALAPLAAAAQDASEAEKAALTEIAKCLVAGLPKDWRQAEMTVELATPNAEIGDARYHFRRNLAGGEYETFAPCDYQKPPRALVALRKNQPPDRAAWTSARFTLYSDGKFDLKYDYPKPQ
jgi:hypothetical protein